MVAMNQTATAQVSDAASDPRVNDEVRRIPWQLNRASRSIQALPLLTPRDRVAGSQNENLLHMCRGQHIRSDDRTGRTHLNPYLLARPPPGARARPLALRRQHDVPRPQR
jgi:hypothetical protein